MKVTARSPQDGRAFAVNLKQLRRLAKNTGHPGPWTVRIDKDDDGDSMVLDDNGCWVAHVGRAPDDARFIAAASPAVVLALLDLIEKPAKRKVSAK